MSNTRSITGFKRFSSEAKGYTTFMMTPDKDFGQLVSDKIFMFRPGRGVNPPEIWGVKEVKTDRPGTKRTIMISPD